MIDIHCHPLPGVDDGAETPEDALAMCKMASADGTTVLVAAPHCNYAYEFRPEVNRAKLAELQAAVGESLKLLLGCDFHLSYDNIRRLTVNPKDFTINGTTYLLVELAEQFVPEQIDNVFYGLQVVGLTPIITHPERNSVFRRNPELLFHSVTRGCLAQITALSYTGGFGREALWLTEMWLDRNLVHFFASDAHDVNHRTPVLSTCYKKLLNSKGQELADLLLKRNPEAVIQGSPLPPGPKPIEAPTTARPTKRSWLSFLWD